MARIDMAANQGNLGSELNLRKILDEMDRTRAEEVKLRAEEVKLRAEEAKLRAEQAHIQKRTARYDLAIGVSIALAIVAVTKLFL